MEAPSIYLLQSAALFTVFVAVRGLRDLRVLAARIEEISKRQCASWSSGFPSTQTGKKSFWQLESLRHRLDFLESDHTTQNGLQNNSLHHSSREESLEDLIRRFTSTFNEEFFASSYLFAYRKVSTSHWNIGAETVGNPTLQRAILSSLKKERVDNSSLPALYGYSFVLEKIFSWDEDERYEGFIWLGHSASQPPLQGSEKILSAKINQFVVRAQNRHQVQLLVDQIDNHVDELKGKNDFLNHISHDLRTPLSNIRTVLQLFQLEGMKEDAHELLDCALKNCGTVTSLLEDIIGFAELQNGKMKSISAEFSLTELLDELVLIHLPLARKKNISLSSSSTLQSRDDTILRSDKQHLSRILGNLIENAVKYTERGSVTIEVK